MVTVPWESVIIITSLRCVLPSGSLIGNKINLELSHFRAGSSSSLVCEFEPKWSWYSDIAVFPELNQGCVHLEFISQQHQNLQSVSSVDLHQSIWMPNEIFCRWNFFLTTAMVAADSNLRIMFPAHIKRQKVIILDDENDRNECGTRTCMIRSIHSISRDLMRLRRHYYWRNRVQKI